MNERAGPVRPRVRGEPEPSGRRGHRRQKPVFVDRSGRRRRIVVASGSAVGVAVILALGMLVAGLFGASPLPLPGLPELGGPGQTAPPAPPAPTGVASPPGDRTTGSTAQTTQATATPAATGPGAGPSNTHRNNPTQAPTDRGRPSKP